MKKLAVYAALFFGRIFAQDFYGDEELLLETPGGQESVSVSEAVTQSPAGLITNMTSTNTGGKAQSINITQLNKDEIAVIARSIPAMGAAITKAGIFPLIDAEARYYRNPDAAPVQQKKNTGALYAENPYMQFLYSKDIGSGKEYLSHKTNGTTFFNSYGVYNLRLGLQKENSPAQKNNFDKWGELEFVVFSKLRYVPQNTYGESIRLILYGTDNKKQWNKEFSFNMKQAQNQTFDGGIYSLTLSHLLEKQELEDLRLLFRANTLIFGKVEGSINNFTFDFRPNASSFYRALLEYGKNNRYF